MNENLESQQFEEQQFVTTEDKLGYAEEYIVVKADDLKNDKLLNYSLSNSLDDIKIAIFNRTGLKLKLEKSKWIYNSYLSISVKQLMNKHQVSFSMTTYNRDKVKVICINMRVGDNWFFTKYLEIKGKCYSWDYLNTLERLKGLIAFFLSSEEDDDD